MTWSHVDYNNVELERHDVMLAEKLAAESYPDRGYRGDFEGGSTPTSLHPMFAYACLEADCAPTIVHGPILDEVRRNLARRASIAAITFESLGRPAKCLIEVSVQGSTQG